MYISLANKQFNGKAMKTFKNNIIQRNYLRFLNQTNNLIYYAADYIPIDHQKRKLSQSFKDTFGLSESVDTMQDYQIFTGYGYSRMQELTVISICSDTEFLFKDICENLLYPSNKRAKNYFQKLDQVNNDNFIPNNIDLNIYSEFETLKFGFQLRHICIHNMGFVDETFNQKTNKNLDIDIPFPMTREIMVEQITAYNSFLEILDKLL